MRVSNDEEHDRFVRFVDERSKLKDMKTLQEVDSSSSQMLQIVTYHLVFEYLIEKWIDFKVNNGESMFKGIEKIGFHNKLYIAKNIGMPKDLFNAIDLINRERNKFAHQIFKNGMSENEIRKIGKAVDSITGINGGKFSGESGIKVRVKGIVGYVGADQTNDCDVLMYILLSSLHNHLSNFVFVDIHHSNSREIS